MHEENKKVIYFLCPIIFRDEYSLKAIVWNEDQGLSVKVNSCQFVRNWHIIYEHIEYVPGRGQVLSVVV